jgi:RHS repeat-associated protein
MSVRRFRFTTYDAASNRTALQYPGSKSVQYTYDADNRISKVTDWNSLAVSYSYDAAGRISGANYSNGLSSQYAYDSVGQTLSIQHNSAATALYSEATTWSANGNPTASNISGPTAPGLASANTNYVYNDASELASSTYGAPVSDKNGNLTMQPGFGGSTTFTYDLNNRATSISGPSVNAAMKYLGDGKLAELDSAGMSHRYLIDPTASANRILAELDATGALQIGYVYGPRGMISQISGSQWYGYFHNLQGSTVALVDPTGSLKNSYRYDPFGQKLPSSTELVANSFVFLGSFSVPSALQYSLMTYRIYDASEGRFDGADPARYVADTEFSPFVYARQSPLRFLDPSGLCSIGGLLNYNSDCYSFADNQVLVDTITGIPKAAVTVGSCAVGLQQACDATGFSPLQVAAIQAAGTILTAYYGGPEAADLVSHISDTSKIVALIQDEAPKVANGTLTVSDAAKTLASSILDLGGENLDTSLKGLSSQGLSLSDVGLGGLVSSALQQVTKLTPGGGK